MLTCLASLLLLSRSVLADNGFGAVTTAHIATLKEQIIDFVGTSSQKPDVARLVRVGFHDCASNNCDGCLDMTNPDHDGLESIVRDLDTNLYVEKAYDWETIMSRADYYAFSSQIAAIYAAELSPFYEDGTGDVLEMEFNYGRCTCADAQDDNGEDFPNPHYDFNRVTNYFQRVFGFAMNESIAIMGAHTLGKCHKKASGFKGVWTEDPSFLDNEYYTAIVDAEDEFNWIGEYFKSQGELRFQFQPGPGSHKNGLMMLNVDLGLLFDINPNLSDGGGRVESCGPVTGKMDFEYPSDNKKGFTYVRDCPHIDNEEDGETAVAILNRYADDNSVWLEAFGEAFQKMMDKSPDCTLSPVID